MLESILAIDFNRKSTALQMKKGRILGTFMGASKGTYHSKEFTTANPVQASSERTNQLANSLGSLGYWHIYPTAKRMMF